MCCSLIFPVSQSPQPLYCSPELPSICCYIFLWFPFFFFSLSFFFPPLESAQLNGWMQHSRCGFTWAVQRKANSPPSTIMTFVDTPTSHRLSCCHISNLCSLAGHCKLQAISTFKCYVFKDPSSVLILIIFHFPVLFSLCFLSPFLIAFCVSCYLQNFPI